MLFSNTILVRSPFQLQILIPLQTVTACSIYNLFILDMSRRALYIVDQTPKPDLYKIQPLKKYTNKIQRVSTVLNEVMKVSCPWWRDDLILFDHRVAEVNQFELDGDLSGYNVLLAMHAWNGKRIETSICNNDNYEVRKHILLHLLTYTGNKNIANIPKGVRDHLERYISLTSKKQ
ncbi:hypothetical protein SORBI_3002G212500 [Sorghum bicolor]|uniref:Ubiquitin-like protease family profile domain-containing protein n=1 Tax=Sorghum bicolor TaxID=4558 RepID=A0A1B6QCP3_SORBI|nr:hypothetical protein SORBI_3002G212500 [Sorghum bicolor]